MADHFEFGDVRVWRIGGRIVGGRRPGVAEQLDHNRAEVGGERFEVEDPVGAAGQEPWTRSRYGPGSPCTAKERSGWRRVNRRSRDPQSTDPLRRPRHATHTT